MSTYYFLYYLELNVSFNLTANVLAYDVEAKKFVLLLFYVYLSAHLTLFERLFLKNVLFMF